MIKINLIILCSLFTSISLADPEPSKFLSIFEKFDGIWAYENKDKKFDCSEAVHRITFNLEKKEAYFDWIDSDDTASQRSTYTIIINTNKIIRMQEHGETRIDPDGNLVIWDLIKESDSKYTWHRKDWPSNGSTGYFLKCNNALNN
jgi:hypothetical protein